MRVTYDLNFARRSSCVRRSASHLASTVTRGLSRWPGLQGAETICVQAWTGRSGLPHVFLDSGRA